MQVLHSFQIQNRLNFILFLILITITATKNDGVPFSLEVTIFVTGLRHQSFIASYILWIIIVCYYIDLYNIQLFDWLDIQLIYPSVASLNYSDDSVQLQMMRIVEADTKLPFQMY